MTYAFAFPQFSPPFPGLSPAGSEAVPGKMGENPFRGFPVSPPVFPAPVSGGSDGR